MTPEGALTALAGIIGPVGVGGILVAIYGYKQQASKGRVDAAVPASAVAVSPIAGKDVELLSQAITMHHAALNRVALILEWRHVDQEGKQEDFREFAERREMQAEIAALRAQKKS